MFSSNIFSLSNRARTLLAGAVIAAVTVSCSDDDEIPTSGYNWEIAGNQIVDIKP